MRPRLLKGRREETEARAEESAGGILRGVRGKRPGVGTPSLRIGRRGGTGKRRWVCGLDAGRLGASAFDLLATTRRGASREAEGKGKEGIDGQERRGSGRERVGERGGEEEEESEERAERSEGDCEAVRAEERKDR